MNAEELTCRLRELAEEVEACDMDHRYGSGLGAITDMEAVLAKLRAHFESDGAR